MTYLFIPQSVLRHSHSLFQIDFSTVYDLVLPLSVKLCMYYKTTQLLRLLGIMFVVIFARATRDLAHNTGVALCHKHLWMPVLFSEGGTSCI